MSLNLAGMVRTGFPEQINFPDVLSQLCFWHENINEDTENTIGGDFELHGSGRDFFSALVEEEEHQNRFAIFGDHADASVYCIWLQDNGKQPVVFLSKNLHATILASSIEEFILLLAIGYNDLPNADKTLPPESDKCYINSQFQDWVYQTLKTSIPTTGQAIIDKAINECDDIQEWLSTNCNGW
jgi:hypothetical protein